MIGYEGLLCLLMHLMESKTQIRDYYNYFEKMLYLIRLSLPKSTAYYFQKRERSRKKVFKETLLNFAEYVKTCAQ